MTAGDLISAKELYKSYNGKKALDGLSFCVRRGECFCLLGPNGAGKTTTLKILTGFLKADAGEALVFGCAVMTHIRRLKGKIGIIPQYPALDPLLTIRENLLFFGMLQKLPKNVLRSSVDELLDRFEISHIKNQVTFHCSGGEYQRLMVARAFLKKHDLIFMDEPTSGIDILFKNRLWEYFKQRQRDGMTYFLNTHDLNEAEVLSDRIGFIFGGKLLVIDTPDRLKQMVKGITLRMVFEKELREELYAMLQHKISGTLHRSDHKTIVVITEERTMDVISRVTSVVKDNRITHLEIQPPSLNDVFNMLGVAYAGNNMA